MVFLLKQFLFSHFRTYFLAVTHHWHKTKRQMATARYSLACLRRAMGDNLRVYPRVLRLTSRSPSEAAAIFDWPPAIIRWAVGSFARSTRTAVVVSSLYLYVFSNGFT